MIGSTGTKTVYAQQSCVVVGFGNAPRTAQNHLNGPESRSTTCRWPPGLGGVKLQSMKIARIYTGDDMKSHFDEIEIEIAPNLSGLISELIPATGVIFRETGGDYDYDFHNAPRRQYVVNLDGAVEITVGSGEKRVFGAGEVFLAEDTDGQGHISRAVDGKVRHSLFITLD